MSKTKRKPVVLIVMDGWGIGPANDGNAIALAKKPHYDALVKHGLYAELAAASIHVGLPAGQDGNSEAGHMNIGAGRIVEQDSVIISRSISDGTFFKNPAFLQAAKFAKKHKSRVHLVGMLSDGQSAHSDPDHLVSLITFFNYQKVKGLYLHLFTDGRDSPKYSAIKILRKNKVTFNYYARIATITGRFYGMDRKKAWERTKLAYEAMVMGRAPAQASSAEEAILQAYNRGESDEFIQPTVIRNHDKPVATIGSHDVVIFFNLRSDRARQLAKPFVQTRFEAENPGAFKREKVLRHLFFVAMTDFGPDLGNILTAYPSRDLIDCLPIVLRQYRQLYVAESEKYAHMTYFFNGGYDHPVAGEKRILVASPRTKWYEKTPKMGLGGITRIIARALEQRSYDFIAANFSNADMVAHTGNLAATEKAVACIDQALKEIATAVVEARGLLVVTGDHGNAEELLNLKTGEINTEHSKSPVPLIILGAPSNLKIRKHGVLGDVAPTILQLMGIPKPVAMTGKSLLIKP